MLIIAGAGSGKTLTVASKIAYLIKQGVKPDNILALTFNERAAEELKNRVNKMLANSEDLTISTFHSFCSQVLQDNILNTQLNANFKVIKETAQLVYFVKNINNFGIEHLEFNHEPYTLAEEMKDFISRCKDEFISPDDIRQHIENRKNVSIDEEALLELNNLEDILKIYQSYEDYKTRNNMIDFGDMLCTVYTLLKNNSLILRSYQRRFKFIIVDEFQDTNYIQLQIVFLIASKHDHITVVGDDDQSIYRFRGAYLTNIAEFKRLFPNYVEKTLNHNYRSTKKIVAVANRLIENNFERTKKRLFTHNIDGENVAVVETSSDSSQASYILEAVKELLKKYSANDIAILCRRKSTAEPIIQAFRKYALRFNFVGATGFFHEPIIKDVIAYLRVIRNPLECNAEIIRILNRHNYCIKQIEICRFTCYANQNQLSLYETFDHLNVINLDKFKFLHVKQSILAILGAKKRVKALDLIRNLLFEREFYKYEITLQNTRNIILLNQFYELAEEFNRIYPDSDIEDFTDYLSFASNFKIEEKSLEDQAIVISTVHGVKGMQYPVVIIPDVIERRLPTTYQKDKFAIPRELFKGIKSKFDEKELHIQEERRLLYVAITRAKEKLIMTYAKRYGENKTDSKPSRFLNEIDYKQNMDINFQQANPQETYPEFLSKKDQIQSRLIKQILANLTCGKFNEALENVLLFAKSTRKDLDIKTDLIDKLKEPDYSQLEHAEEENATISENHVFSVSQFIGYKKCPRLYQYRHVMKIPEKPRSYFDFGSSLHIIAEKLTRLQKDGKPINEIMAEQLLAKFWESKGYKSKIDERRDYLEAKNILKIFVEEQSKSKMDIVDIERWFEISIGDLKLRGRIDRIDREGSGFTIIDYKTSKKAASLNELKKDMQLLVYAIAANEMYGGSPVKVGNWFLRTNKKLFFKPENQSIEAVRTEIADLAVKIRAAVFEPKKGSWECTQCDYRCLCD